MALHDTFRVLVAGIAGASLGTEIAKALRAADGYHLIGCDISPLAFGHYARLFDRTVLVSAERYVDELLALCCEEGIDVVVPGGEQPTTLIAAASDRFRSAGIRLAMNAPDVVARLADKASCFAELARLGFAIPRTVPIVRGADWPDIPLPCVIKPSTGSGGSAFVFFARDAGEAQLYATYLLNNSMVPIAQEYVAHTRGEFTVGALSAPDGELLGTIALERAFPNKLSVSMKGSGFLISSGYTQGRIAAFPDVCATVGAIARAVGSVGPLNVQGRVDERGRFLPFEINPRFSASTYLRTLAGFNEVDAFIRRIVGAPAGTSLAIKPGWYLRSLTEVAVADGELRS
jgi:carbamoyl-phosphate synthase large subunit